MDFDVISHKSGDTFIARCTYLDESGAAANYAALGITIDSQVRRPTGELVATLALSPGVGTGAFVLRSATTGWPIGKLLWDIQFTIGSEIFSTQTAVIVVTKDVTQ